MDRDVISEEISSALSEIARKCLRIETLETKKIDRLEFHDLAVWNIKDALAAAYELGRNTAISQ